MSVFVSVIIGNFKMQLIMKTRTKDNVLQKMSSNSIHYCFAALALCTHKTNLFREPWKAKRDPLFPVHKDPRDPTIPKPVGTLKNIVGIFGYRQTVRKWIGNWKVGHHSQVLPLHHAKNVENLLRLVLPSGSHLESTSWCYECFTHKQDYIFIILKWSWKETHQNSGDSPFEWEVKLHSNRLQTFGYVAL